MEQIKPEKIDNKAPELTKEILAEEFDSSISEEGFENNVTVATGKEKALKDIQSAKEIPKKEYEEIKTMADFIKILEDKLATTGDVQEKNAIAYSLLRVKNIFAELKIKPEKFKIGVIENGKWGAYNKNSQELRAAPELLELIKDCKMDMNIMGISFKEAEIEKSGVADTGFQQLMIEKSGVNSGEYHKKERGLTKRIFGVEKNVLDLIDKPKEFADYFLEKEIEKRLKQGRKIKAKDLAPYLLAQFKKGAPKLYKKLQASGYDFRKRVKEIISRLKSNK